MEPNTHSTGPAGWTVNREVAGEPVGGPGERLDRLVALTAAVDELAEEDLGGLTDAVVAERVLALRRQVDRLEGQWLKVLAAVDAQGAAGAEDGIEVGSTAAWLRGRLRLGAGAASSAVRTARALFRGPLTATPQALTTGELSVAHASVLASGIRELPDHVSAEAEPVLVEAARRLDPPGLRRVLGHLRLVADPDGADAQAERRHQRRGVWLAPTWERMVAIDGLLEAEAGQTLLAALEPLARPADASDTRSGSQRTADALTELARRALEGGQLPQTGGVRPQLAVTVDLDSLLGHPIGLGGEIGGMGPLAPETCRRLACDGAVTRVVVTRQPTHRQHLTGPCDDQDHLATGHPGGHHHPGHGPGAEAPWPASDPGAQAPPLTGQLSAGASAIAHDPTETPGPEGLEMRLRAAMALLPPSLGGARPTPGRRAGHPGRPAGPAHRPGRPRRRLCLPRLCPPPVLVRGASSVALGRWRADRPGQPGPGVPGPSSGGP